MDFCRLNTKELGEYLFVKLTVRTEPVAVTKLFDNVCCLMTTEYAFASVNCFVVSYFRITGEAAAPVKVPE